MENKEELALEFDGDALPEPAHGNDGLSFEISRGRLNRPQDKRTPKSNFLKALAENARFERIEIDRNVGKFRHAAGIIAARLQQPELTMRYALAFFAAICALAWSAAEVRPQTPRTEANVATGLSPARSGLKPAATFHAPELLIPVQGITAAQLRNTFHERRGGGRTHQAIDILAPYGTPVVATHDGKIRKLFTSKAGGITIYQTDAAEEKIYYYAHLDRYAEGVLEGKMVSRGEVIGYVGTSGNAGNTPHLHFAITILPPTKEWWKGEAIDPYPLLKAAGAVASGVTTPSSAPR
jgi:murein DD-endopeptidase MepM/ murein hydrolase activator NlpD